MLPFLVLGLVQGLTEFLPISSSGHLALAQWWMGLENPSLLFDTLVHLGTVASVVVFYHERLFALVRHPFSPQARRLWLALALGTLPIAVVGLLFKDAVEVAFSTPQLVATGLLWTGVVLFFSGRKQPGVQSMERLRLWQLTVIGAAQALAVFPGVSRSGMTIVAALWVGLKKDQAAEFSFLLMIPAILGATGLQVLQAFRDWNVYLALWPQYALGTAVAFAAGLLAIGVLLRLLQRRGLRVFAYYCWVLGLSAWVWVWLA